MMGFAEGMLECCHGFDSLRSRLASWQAAEPELTNTAFVPSEVDLAVFTADGRRLLARVAMIREEGMEIYIMAAINDAGFWRDAAARL
jgi:hypothetical protein